MPKSHCVSFPPGDDNAVLRQSFIEITKSPDGGLNHCAAMVLSQMMWCHECRVEAIAQARLRNAIAQKGGAPATQDTDVWFLKGQPEMKADLMHLFGETAISKAFSLLIERGYLEWRHDPRHPWDRTRQYRFVVEAVQNALAALDPVNLRDGEMSVSDGEYPPAPDDTTGGADSAGQHNVNLRDAPRKKDTLDGASLRPQSRTDTGSIPQDSALFNRRKDKSMEERETERQRGTNPDSAADASDALSQEPTYFLADGKTLYRPAFPMGAYNVAFRVLFKREPHVSREMQEPGNAWAIKVVYGDGDESEGCGVQAWLDTVKLFFQLGESGRNEYYKKQVYRWSLFMADFNILLEMTLSETRARLKQIETQQAQENQRRLEEERLRQRSQEREAQIAEYERIRNESMPPELRGPWQAVLAKVKTEVNGPTYQAHIKGLYPVAKNGHEIVLAAPTSFTVQYLSKDRFTSLFSQAFGEALGQDSLRVKFRAEESQTAAKGVPAE